MDLGNRGPYWCGYVQQGGILVRIWAAGGQVGAELGHMGPGWHRSARLEAGLVQALPFGGTCHMGPSPTSGKDTCCYQIPCGTSSKTTQRRPAGR